MSFAEPWPGDEGEFVNEFELPGRSEAEGGLWPDCAVLWRDVVWLVELKADKESYRPNQIPDYLHRCRYDHPRATIACTYLAPPMGQIALREAWARFAHVTWEKLAPDVKSIWSSCPDPKGRSVVEALLDAIERLGPALSQWLEQWRAKLGPEVEPPEELRARLEETLELARLTAADHVQRAVDWFPPDAEWLERVRLEVRKRLAAAESSSPLRHVGLWLWSPRSAGPPKTHAGEQTGCELRLSWYESPRY